MPPQRQTDSDVNRRISTAISALDKAIRLALNTFIKQTGQNFAETNEAIATVAADLATLTTTVETLQTDVATLQTDLATAQADILALQADLAALQTTVSTLTALQVTYDTGSGTITVQAALDIVMPP